MKAVSYKWRPDGGWRENARPLGRQMVPHLICGMLSISQRKMERTMARSFVPRPRPGDSVKRAIQVRRTEGDRQDAPDGKPVLEGGKLHEARYAHEWLRGRSDAGSKTLLTVRGGSVELHVPAIREQPMLWRWGV